MAPRHSRAAEKQLTARQKQRDSGEMEERVGRMGYDTGEVLNQGAREAVD